MRVRFYDGVDDGLLKFAVIILKSDGNGCFANTKKGTPMRCRADTEKPANKLTIRQKEN